MAEVRDFKSFQDTRSHVPGHLGPDRGRVIVVKIGGQGVWVRPKGLSSGKVFVSWEEIYSYGIVQEAREKVKQKRLVRRK